MIRLVPWAGVPTDGLVPLPVIDGHEILGVQVREQFRRLTGQPWPDQIAAMPPLRRAGQTL